MAIRRVQMLRQRRTEAEAFLNSAREEHAKYYDRGREPLAFKRGDWVLLSTKSLALRRPSRKLSPKFQGPYQVERVVGHHGLPAKV